MEGLNPTPHLRFWAGIRSHMNAGANSTLLTSTSTLTTNVPYLLTPLSLTKLPLSPVLSLIANKPSPTSTWNSPTNSILKSTKSTSIKILIYSKIKITNITIKVQTSNLIPPKNRCLTNHRPLKVNVSVCRGLKSTAPSSKILNKSHSTAGELNLSYSNRV